MKMTIDWLLESDPWVEYRTRIDLLGQTENDEPVRKAKKDTLAHPMIQQLIADIGEWKSEVISNHKKAGAWTHKLSFLNEVGLKADDDAGLKRVIEQITEHVTEQGVPQVLVNIPKRFGGSGEDTWGWSLCDAPLVMFSLMKIGDWNHRDGLKYLMKNVRENGWPCSVSPELGKFRGPGRKSDPCPYATLLMLKVLAQTSDLKDSEQAHIGTDCLLELWEKSKDTHPYIFYMGTDFRKLKAPFVWYDILHVADVLSQFERVTDDVRFADIVAKITEKRDSDGRYTPQSQWLSWKGFEFAQKKQPSAWLTFLVMRILRRLEQ
ncbi:MAG: hypothetical protein HN948_00530 [Clostridia bacterium]|jgi:hypothetical protein|nr:hypothetical protein [Clostridia bacterium]MBT7121473.1 hypothetical protein [Clostridia bacterium]